MDTQSVHAGVGDAGTGAMEDGEPCDDGAEPEESLQLRSRSSAPSQESSTPRQPTGEAETNLDSYTNIPLLTNNNVRQLEDQHQGDTNAVEPYKHDNVVSRSLASVDDTDRTDEVLAKKERCADLRLYLVNYCFILAFYMIQSIYNVGVVRTIERKFGLRSAQSGFIMSMNDIAHVLAIVFVSYFGKRAHIPKFMSLSLVLTSLAGLMMASPYMIFGDGSSTSDPVVNHGGLSLISSNGNDTSHLYNAYGADDTDDPMVCDPNRQHEECTEEQIEMDSANMVAYHIMLAAQFIGGVGGSGVTTLGFSYIDENTSTHKSGLYIGIAAAVMSFSPVAALGLAAICLRLPENPLQITDLSPEDPKWIGCWWLGYVISATGITLSCIPMWFFPRHIVKQKKSDEAALPGPSIKHQLKDLPRSLWRLLKNGPFMMLVLMSILLIYGMVCLYINMPRYFEIHFMQPAFVSNFVAVSAAVAAVIGNVTSGLIMHKLRLKPKGATKLLIISISSLVIGVGITMCLGCPQIDVAGQWQQNGELSPALPCNSNCSCSDSDYKPVCGEDGLTYFSPCYAGCSESSQGNYSNCVCTSEDIGASVSDGKCDVECDMMLPYIIINVLFSFVGSLCKVPSTIVMFRVVGDEQRAFALGINSFLCNLLAFMPSPVIFGAMVDSTCIMWERTCSGTGSCLLYNSRMLRLAIHGTSLAFKILTFLCTIVIFAMIKDKVFTHEEEESEKEEKPVCV